MIRAVTLTIVLWAAGVAVMAAGPYGNVRDLAFLSGHWGGEVEGFQADEIWSTAANGSLMGVYREMKDGKTTFFEFLTIEQEESGPVLRLRHFKPKMQELEVEPTLFFLTSASSKKAVFEGGNKVHPVRMTFEQKVRDKLEIVLEHKLDDGEWSHELFAYTRQPL